MTSPKAWLFIDGYNFYYAIKNSPDLHLSGAWCDFRKLAVDHLLEKPFRLEKIKYFTAHVPEARMETSPGEGRRQAIWLQALKTIEGLEIVAGFHRFDEFRLRKEKQTDVNIAVELLMGATQENGYDKAVLISGDTDLIPAVAAVTSRIDQPKVVDVWLPPSTTPSPHWKRRLNATKVPVRVIDPRAIYASRFPDKILYNGKLIECDPRWRVPSGLARLKLLRAPATTARKT
jgi:uncharacterized LabA/DUF88 family protein